jgi:Lamin Tail Domain
MPRPAPAGAGSGVVQLAAMLAAVTLSACSDQQPLAAHDPSAAPVTQALQAFECTGSLSSGTVSCKELGPKAGQASGVLIGGQNVNLKLTSSNVSYNSGTGIVQFDVTVQNLMNEAIGTPDGTVADPDGVQVFFSSGPHVTNGSGTVTVANADGTGTFTGSSQPYFAYHEILAHNAVSSARTWQMQVTGQVSTFNFVVYVETDVQYLLVINEVMVNPPAAANPSNPANPDLTAEWFELYNAGTRPVNLQNLVIADSAASGRRPYHRVTASLVVPSGGYVVLGNSINTAQNGGAPVDYAYGSALQLANSLDAVKVARVFGTDTLTIDRTQYASAATSAQDGVTRELKNPALDNSNMDGSNWASALVTAVFGTGGRGTPKAQNSTFTP